MVLGRTPGRVERLWLSALSGALGALPDHCGQFAVADRYLRRRRFASGSVAIQRMRGGARVVLDLGDHTQGIAYLTRRYASEVADYVIARLPARGVFVDVGAHVGLLSFAVVRRRPGARVIAFEPHGPNAAAWLEAARLNPGDAMLERTALGESDGVAWLLAGEDSGAARIDGDGTIEVPQARLDSFARAHALGSIDVLKLDAEGAEPSILAGASDLLAARAIGTIVCELNAPLLERRGSSAAELTATITAAGYRRVALPAPRRGHRPSPDDALLADVAFERIDD